MTNSNWGLRRRFPDMIIHRGQYEHYIHRWFLIPRNHIFNIYLHKLLLDDYEAPHDHPWWNLSFILKGEYWETLATAELISNSRYIINKETKLRKRFSLILRRATDIHRLAVSKTTLGYAWSLFITGPTIRTWGFWGRYGWVSHEILLAIDRERGTSIMHEDKRRELL